MLVGPWRMAGAGAAPSPPRAAGFPCTNFSSTPPASSPSCSSLSISSRLGFGATSRAASLRAGGRPSPLAGGFCVAPPLCASCGGGTSTFLKNFSRSSEGTSRGLGGDRGGPVLASNWNHAWPSDIGDPGAGSGCSLRAGLVGSRPGPAGGSADGFRGGVPGGVRRPGDLTLARALPPAFLAARRFFSSFASSCDLRMASCRACSSSFRSRASRLAASPAPSPSSACGASSPSSSMQKP